MGTVNNSVVHSIREYVLPLYWTDTLFKMVDRTPLPLKKGGGGNLYLYISAKTHIGSFLAA